MDDVIAAYEAIAPTYDAEILSDRWVRESLWDHYRRVFRAGDRVLDVACGTGIDSIFLAQQGIQVTAIDVSPAMVARLQHKARAAGVDRLIDARLHDFSDLTPWPAESFDGVISGFAGLSMLPDLTCFAAESARLLRPRGRLIVHLLNRFSIWELLGLLARRRLAMAWSLHRQAERRFTISGRSIPHHLFLPRETYCRFFASRYRVRQVYSHGALRPPDTLHRIPRPIVTALRWLEPRSRDGWPFRDWGRFYVLDLERRT